MKAKITVTLKPGVLDPQGKAIEGALASLAIGGIRSVRQGKLFDVELDGGDRPGAEAALGRACEVLLANTVIENYQVVIDEGSVLSGAPVAGDLEMASEPRPAASTVPSATQEDAAAASSMPAEGHP